MANGLRLHLGLRDERWDGQPFTWARAFVMAYCGVTDQQARDAVYELWRKQQTIERVNESLSEGEKRRPKKPILWRLAGTETLESVA